MARSGAAWGCAAALWLTACGGQSFVLDADAGAGSDAGTTIDAAADAPPANFEIACGATQCPYPQACCNGTDNTPVNCTGGNGQCGGCQDRLTCASAANCPGNMLCCIGPGPTAASGCSGGQSFASTCRLLCSSKETRLCNPTNPSASPCLAGRTCSSAASDLAQWGLPSDTSGYGVCPLN